jgi:hypothetical protein
LDRAVLEAQETTGDLLYELVSVKKMSYPAANGRGSNSCMFNLAYSQFQ